MLGKSTSACFKDLLLSGVTEIREKLTYSAALEDFFFS